MIITNSIRTLALASIVAGGALATFAQSASAAEPSAPAISEIVVTKNADLDGDGDTDGRDFLIWQRTVGADYDNDGDVDGRDFLVWQRGSSPNPIGTGDLADWQSNYGVGS